MFQGVFLHIEEAGFSNGLYVEGIRENKSKMTPRLLY